MNSTAPFATEILKTGFVLEDRIARTLKTAGWTVISNKYYVDDAEESVREIDLVAYKVSKIQHLDVYTVLIISCKKSEANVWAMLARDLNLKDPNSDWWPLHAWSNDKAISHQLGESGKAKAFHEAASKNGVDTALSVPAVEVFAFQEMDKTSGKPQNDKPIFAAITSLMKAQAYELSSLPSRKKAPAIYQFNLLSVIDSELVRLNFSDTGISQETVDSEHYIGRYIVRKQNVAARVRFLTASAFEHHLPEYTRLHQSNCGWFGGECDAFYRDILKDWKRTAVLSDEFWKAIKLRTSWRLKEHFKKDVEVPEPSIFWMDSDSEPRVGFDLPQEVLEYMNNDSHVRKIITQALEKIYRYNGGFSVTWDIPF